MIRDVYATAALKKMNQENELFIPQESLPAGLFREYEYVVISYKTLSDILGISQDKIKYLMDEWPKHKAEYSDLEIPFLTTCPDNLSFAVFERYNRFVQQLNTTLVAWMKQNNFNRPTSGLVELDGCHALIPWDLRFYMLHLYSADTESDIAQVKIMLQNPITDAIVYQNEILM